MNLKSQEYSQFILYHMLELTLYLSKVIKVHPVDVAQIYIKHWFSNR